MLIWIIAIGKRLRHSPVCIQRTHVRDKKYSKMKMIWVWDLLEQETVPILLRTNFNKCHEMFVF